MIAHLWSANTSRGGTAGELCAFRRGVYGVVVTSVLGLSAACGDSESARLAIANSSEDALTFADSIPRSAGATGSKVASPLQSSESPSNALGALPGASTRGSVDLDAQASPGNVHPRPELILRPKVRSTSLALGRREAGSLPNVLTGAIRVATIGYSAERVGDAFGEITRVTIDKDGYIYVLDGEFSDVRIFDPEGRPIKRLGFVHDPKSPFRSPAALAQVATSGGAQLFIADKARKVHVYSRSQDSVSHRRSMNVEHNAHDLCIADERIIAQGGGFYEPDLVSTYSMEGTPLLRFGAVYNTTDQILRYTFAFARLLCDSSTDMVVLIPETSIPDVRAYDARGTPRWIATFSGYVPVPAQTGRGGTVTVILPPAGYHRFHSIGQLPTGELLLQLAFVVPPATALGEEATITSVLITPADGHATLLGDSLPPIVAVGSRSFVIRLNTPSPALEIWKFPQPSK